MANTQNMLYDSDAGAANTAATRRFVVRPGIPVRISAAGLSAGECVPVYTYVGAAGGMGPGCGTCSVEEPDYKWTPLVRCGVPVTLCDTSMEFVEKLPGTYSVGDPASPLSFAGDVNITSLELTGEYLDVPFCEPQSDTPLPVEVISSCAEPVYVEVCNVTPTLIETAMAELGCVFNPDGSLLGKVIIQRIDDEDAGTYVYEQTLFQTDGTVVTPYTGPWTVCDAPPTERPVFIYLERNGGVVTMGDIVATTGAARVHSVTVKQVTGTGAVMGDSGSGVPLSTGETWSWSAVSGDNMDTLMASALSLDANGGEQRITATYTV